MEIQLSTLRQTLVDYLVTEHCASLENILLSGETNKAFAVKVNALQLFEIVPDFAEYLQKDPSGAQHLLHDSLKCALHKHASRYTAQEFDVKKNVRCRITGFPASEQETQFPNSDFLGKFIILNGTIIRATSVRVLENKKQFICVKCKHEFFVETCYELYNALILPTTCPSPLRCSGTRFVPVSEEVDSSHCCDYQELRLQEKLDSGSTTGVVARAIWIIAQDDLVDHCRPGDEVIITGVLSSRFRGLFPDKRPDIDLFINAHSIEVFRDEIPRIVLTDRIREIELFWATYQDRKLQGRDIILKSICPQIYGLYLVKLAVGLVLMGGVEKSDSGSTIRGSSHLLLVGDPGTGKSQFLKYIAKLCPDSVLTTGTGSTTAGLTASVSREGNDWTLQAGALVMADGDICCIDEFNSLRPHDRESILEAMEQQCISIAKAGQVCRLNTRCAIVATSNPKTGPTLNENSDMTLELGLSGPLLSRFDLVLNLRDTQSRSWDERVSSFVLSGDTGVTQSAEDNELWSLHRMRTYLHCCRKLKPVLSDDAHRILQEYYNFQRKSDVRDVARTTLRLLESLVRLSQAHARLMFRNTVEAQDALVAVILMETSKERNSSLIVGLPDTLQMDFPDNPDEIFRQSALNILNALNLEDIYDKLCLDVDIFNEFDDLGPLGDQEGVEAFPLDSTHLSIAPDPRCSQPAASREKDANDQAETSAQIRKRTVPWRHSFLSNTSTATPNKKSTSVSDRLSKFAYDSSPKDVNLSPTDDDSFDFDI